MSNVDGAANSFIPFALDSRLGSIGADMLWNCLMENVQEFINSNGGETINKVKKSYRPNWNHVKDMLNQLPIDDLIECLSESN